MSVRKSTREIYDKHIKEYTNFYQARELGRMFQLQSLRCYVAHLHQEGKAYSSILGRMSALKYFCRLQGRDNDLDDHTLLMTIRGVRNVNSQHTSTRSLSQVISIKDLKNFSRITAVLFDTYRARLIQTAMVTAFSGFLGVSEYAKTKAGHTLLREDCRVGRSQVTIYLRSGKSDNNPVTIKLPAQKEKRVCPVDNLRRYLMIRPQSAAKELFVLSNGAPMGDSDVRNWLKKICNSLNKEPVSPHAFRIGGASWASVQGWTDSAIRAHGRWKSDAFLRYIRPL